MKHKPTRAFVGTILICFSLVGCISNPDTSSNRKFFQTDLTTTPLLPGVVVSSAHPLATEAGLRILENGGNAFDAAVAISAALAVVEPASSGFGGGGFWLLHRESDGKQVVIDGREKAPLAATRDMYLNSKGNVIKWASSIGALAAAIPGMPAALAHINTQYGKLSLAETLQPALEYAEQGFVITPRLKKHIEGRKQNFTLNALQTFVEKPMSNNQLVVQKDLAAVIKRFAAAGFKGFYRGKTAEKLLMGVRAGGGIWSASDLHGYKVIEREPISFNYGNAKIVVPPLPSSGGIVLQQVLQILQSKHKTTGNMGNGQQVVGKRLVPDYHLLVEAMRLAYRERALHMGDPKFIAKKNIEQLTDSDYIQSMANSIDANYATPSKKLLDHNLWQSTNRQQGQDTTHFSVVDAQGNRVSATLSINFPFGSCFMAPDTGIFLNNEMDDFSAKPGIPNGYGLVGSTANAIEPEKRPLSSMTPMFIEKPDQVTVIGTPGGSRIISMMVLAVLGIVDFNLPIQEVVNLPRFHHQFLPDEIQFEKGAIDEISLKRLTNMGHVLNSLTGRYGNMHAVQWQQKSKGVYDMQAVSDYRGEGVGQVLWQIKEK